MGNVEGKQRMLKTVMVNEERYRPIVENNVDGIMIVDQNGTTRYVNKAAEALLGPKAKGLLDEVFEFPFPGGGTTSAELLRPDGGVTIATVEISPARQKSMNEAHSASHCRKHVSDWISQDVLNEMEHLFAGYFVGEDNA